MFQIILLITFLGVAKAIIEVRKTYKCPDEESIISVMKGLERNETTKSNVTRHLGVCERCRGLIDQLNL